MKIIVIVRASAFCFVVSLFCIVYVACVAAKGSIPRFR